MKGPKTPIRVLLVEDNPDDAELVLRELRRYGFDPDWKRLDTEEEYLASLRPDLDIILSDFRMPHFDGLRALTLLKERELDVPFLLISGTVGEETAVAAMKLGATDYLLKDRLARLGPSVAQALEQSRLRKERHQAEQELREREELNRAVLNSMRAHIAVLDRGVEDRRGQRSLAAVRAGMQCQRVQRAALHGGGGELSRGLPK